MHDFYAHATSGSHTEALTSTAAIERATAWPHYVEVYADVVTDAEGSDVDEHMVEDWTFSLQRRVRTVACCMHAKVGNVEYVTISLQPDECVALGRGSAAITMKNLKFEGVDLIADSFLSSLTGI